MDVKKLHNNILSALPSDPIAQTHLKDKSQPWWCVDDAGFLCLDDRIYIPDSDDLHLRVLQYKHNHPLAGHFGQNHTQLLWREYTWPGIQTFVKDYVWSCTSCTQAKTPHHWPYGLLKQLPVPEKPWNSISMDFIEQLPQSSGFTAILVIVDWLSKQAIFMIPSLAQNLPSSSYSTCSPNTESWPMSLLTVVPNLYPISSGPLVKPSICAYTSPPGTTQKEMARPSTPIRSSNSICMSTPTINKTTGPSYSHWWSSLITMLLALLPEFCHSLPTTSATWQKIRGSGKVLNIWKKI